MKSRVTMGPLAALMLACVVVSGCGDSFRASRAVNRWRAEIRSGTPLVDVLHQVGSLYQRYPKAWIFITAWGTREASASLPHDAARSSDAVEGLTWTGGEPKAETEVAKAAAALSTCKQVWFTLRTFAGYLHFSVTLDNQGKVQSVSEMSGHQA